MSFEQKSLNTFRLLRNLDKQTDRDPSSKGIGLVELDRETLGALVDLFNADKPPVLTIELAAWTRESGQEGKHLVGTIRAKGEPPPAANGKASNGREWFNRRVQEIGEPLDEMLGKTGGMR